MEKRIKDIFVGFVIGCILMTTTPVLANTILQKIDVMMNAVIVEINGEKLDSTSILYNGSTYLPLRKVAEAVDKDVEWNQETMTANIIDEKQEVTMINMEENINYTEIEFKEFINQFEIGETIFNDIDNYFLTTINYNGSMTLDEIKSFLNIINNPNRNDYLKRIYDEIVVDNETRHLVRFRYTNDMFYFLGVITKENNEYIIDFSSCDL